jgi:hypothetical protein
VPGTLGQHPLLRGMKRGSGVVAAARPGSHGPLRAGSGPAQTHAVGIRRRPARLLLIRRSSAASIAARLCNVQLSAPVRSCCPSCHRTVTPGCREGFQASGTPMLAAESTSKGDGTAAPGPSPGKVAQLDRITGGLNHGDGCCSPRGSGRQVLPLADHNRGVARSLTAHGQPWESRLPCRPRSLTD